MNDIQVPHLRPLKAGEILDRAFRLYRAHFWLFIGIAGILLVPLLVLELLSLFIFNETNIVSLIQSFLTIYLLDGAIMWTASCTYLGLPISVNDSYRQARRVFKSFLGANFVQGVAYIPVGIFLVVGAAMGTIGVIVAWIFAIPYISFFSTRWGLSHPAIMFEKLDASHGLKKSWSLTSKDFWHVFVVLVASGLLSYLVVSIPELIITSAMELFEPVRTIGPVLSSVFTYLGMIISIPLAQIILVVAYYDLRVRREGYDLQFALESDPVRAEPDAFPEEGLSDVQQ